MRQLKTTLFCQVKLQPLQIALFDKAYVDYKQYAAWIKQTIFFVTRLKDNAIYEQLEEIDIPDRCPDNYIKDEKYRYVLKMKAERSSYLHNAEWFIRTKKKDRIFQFLTNIFEMDTEQIGLLDKKALADRNIV